MKKNNLTVNRLKDRLKEDLEKEVILENKENLLKEEDLKEVVDFNLINEISKIDEIKLFLKEQTIKLFNIQSKNVLLLGEIFMIVHEKLSSPGSEEGVYEKWLDINNFNKTTAWRYRQRYMLYLKVKEDKKIIIASLPYGVINTLLKNREFEDVVNIVDSFNNKKELLDFIQEDLQVKKINKKDRFEDFEIKNYFVLFENLEEKVEKLDDNKKHEVKKHLDILEKLLNS